MGALVPVASDDLVAVRDPAEYVTLACERAKSWLDNALEHGDIELIVEFKSQAEAIRIYTAQKQLGKDAELLAAEIVRRAERGIGLAIRKGQQAGEIETPREASSRAGRSRQRLANSEPLKPRPLDYATADELSGNGAGIYQLTDGVSDEQFEAAIEKAKTEGNLSRANVVRRVRATRDIAEDTTAATDEPAMSWVPAGTDRGPQVVARRRELIREWAGEAWTSAQMAQRLGVAAGTVRKIARTEGFAIPADEVVGRTRKLNSNHVVERIVTELDRDTLEMALKLVRFEELDLTTIPSWTTSLDASIRVLRRFSKDLKEMIQ